MIYFMFICFTLFVSKLLSCINVFQNNYKLLNKYCIYMYILDALLLYTLIKVANS